MPILQRCPSCRGYVNLTVKVCSCGTDLRITPRDIHFRKQIDGKRRYHRAGNITLREAEIQYGLWAASMDPPPPTGVAMASEDLSLRCMFDAYLEKLRGEGKRYHKKVTLFFDRMIEAWGDIPCLQLTPAMVKAFQASLRAAKLTPAYCDRHLAMLRAAWNYSLPDAPNPVKRVRFYNPDNRVTEFLTEDEEQRLLEAAKNPGPRAPRNFEAIIIVAMNTGLRLQNVLALHTEEVDFERGTITVRQKRNRGHRIPMNSVVREALESIRPLDGGYFFPSHYSARKGEPIKRIDGTFRNCKTEAALEKPFRFHGLRHNLGTKLLRKTGNLALVKEALGHADIATTLRYAHVLDEDLREGLEAAAIRNDSRNDSPAEMGPSKVVQLRKK